MREQVKGDERKKREPNRDQAGSSTFPSYDIAYLSLRVDIDSTVQTPIQTTTSLNFLQIKCVHPKLRLPATTEIANPRTLDGFFAGVDMLRGSVRKLSIPRNLGDPWEV